MSDKPDEYDDAARELLPCCAGQGQGAICTINGLYVGYAPDIPAGRHSSNCPASYRPAVAAALRKERADGYRDGVEAAAKVADEHNLDKDVVTVPLMIAKRIRQRGEEQL